MKKWAALHQEDGTELTPETAPGYERALLTNENSASWEEAGNWPPAPLLSVWTRKKGGKCISQPKREPVTHVLHN